MSPAKVKKHSFRSQYAHNATEKLSQNLNEKLKEFKTWAQVKSPKSLQPALSYALDWLAPELLGTGFRMYEVGDFAMKAVIPAHKSNLDSQFEIHQGLVVNSVLELSKVFIQRQMPDKFFQVTSTELNLVKKHKWAEALNLAMTTSQEDMDDFFVLLQKNKKSSLKFKVDISAQNKKKSDFAILQIQIETTDLIA